MVGGGGVTPFRVYAPDECGPDGYPFAWHGGLMAIEDPDGLYVNDYATTVRWEPHDGKRHPGEVGVKHIVRMLAGHRCVRCLHPFVCGETPGEWSPCDERCLHGLPVRFRYKGDWHEAGILAPGDIGKNIALGYQFEAKARVLTVHHLRLGADAKRDLRWWNLAALCQRCHLTIQGKVRMERVWPWPHSDWFKPYAAGWYAWSYLGEDLTRAEVEARMDELLALELAA